MARKILALVFGVMLLGGVLGPALAATDYPVMRPDNATLKQWLDDYNAAPLAFIDPALREKIKTSDSHSLLGRISYNPDERNQGSCGDCWVWAGAAILEAALSVQTGIVDRLSIQYLNSCYADRYACNGGNLSRFAEFYSSTQKAIPWSNSGAWFQDGSKACGAAASSCVSCGSISTSPNYNVASITAQAITTRGVGAAAAINNIKNILHQNRAVWLSIYWPDDAAFRIFSSNWSNGGAGSIYSTDYMQGMTAGNLSGHAMVIVGYDDADRTWTVLNSWGTASGSRPSGVFKLAMDINYDCTINHAVYGNVPVVGFQTLSLDMSGDGGGDIGGKTGFGVWANNLYCTNGSTFGFAGTIDGGVNWLYSFTYYGYASTFDGYYIWPAGRKTVHYAYGCGSWDNTGRGLATLQADTCYLLLPYIDTFGYLQVGLYDAGPCSAGASGLPPDGGDILGKPGERYGATPLAPMPGGEGLPLGLRPPDPLD